jgi:hypothetical protein
MILLRSLDSYTQHDNQPYCKTCYGKLFAPKGFTADDSLANDRHHKVADTDEYLQKSNVAPKLYHQPLLRLRSVEVIQLFQLPTNASNAQNLVD